MTNLLVTGLDLETGLEVHVEERSVKEWYKKGHNGDRTLVCAECYVGTDLPDGPRSVALVPKGREHGVRRAHFAHPSGQAPPGGHTPESEWHSTSKHRFRRWAIEAGAVSARVEACTPDRRRRSDVAIVLAGGQRLALEVQLQDIPDRQWLNRQHDYDRNGIRAVWIWPSEAEIPHVVYAEGQPGWVYDARNDRLGLACGRPHDHTGEEAEARRCRSTHWPPCPGDSIEIRWMRLRDVELSDGGLVPAPHVLVQLEAEAKAADAAETRQKAHGAVDTHIRPSAPARPRPAPPVTRPQGTHWVQRIDARPPWTDPDCWWYWCPACEYLTGAHFLTRAQIKSSEFRHEIMTTGTSATEQDGRSVVTSEVPTGECTGIMPPICHVCRLTPSDVPDGMSHFTLIFFGETGEEKMGPTLALIAVEGNGHPYNAVWFCNEHAAIAHDHEDRHLKEALAAINAQTAGAHAATEVERPGSI
jgi:Competence protein CoiA-like family